MGRSKKSDGGGCLVVLGLIAAGCAWFWDEYGTSITNAWNWLTDNWIMIVVSIVVIVVLLAFAGKAIERKEAEEEAERERQEAEEEAERERRIEMERKKRELEEERERIERKREIARKRKARRNALIERYDEDIADKIMAGEIWLDQTPEQLKDSLGEPDDKDIKVLKTKSKEIWKYDEIGKNRYRKIITIENGLVVGWEMK